LRASALAFVCAGLNGKRLRYDDLVAAR